MTRAARGHPSGAGRGSPPGADAATAPRGPLSGRDFQLFLTARAVSRLGDGMVPVALAAGLVGAGHGISAVSYALGAWTVCFAGFVVPGGVLADRFAPRRMMVLADALRLAGAAALVPVFAGGDPALWLVYVLSALGGVGAALFQPGIASTIPVIAADVQRANAIVRVAESLVGIAGPAVAGVLAGLGGAPALFVVDAATFGVSGVCLAMLVRVPTAQGRSRTMVADLVMGWRKFRARRWLWGVIAVWTGYALFVLGPLVPLQAVLITQAHGVTTFGMIMAVHGAGNAAGAVVAMRLRPSRPLAAGSLALLGVAASAAALAAGASVPLLGAAFFAGGAGLAFWLVMWSTAVQTHVAPEDLNQMHAYEVAGSVSTLAAGRALAGPASDSFGAHALLFGAAIVNCGVVAVLLLVRAIRDLPRVPSRDGRD